MEISLLQAFALGIIAFIAGLDMFNGLTHMHRPVVLGPLVGLVLGDLHTGILTGGTLELVWMGLAPLAGAQPPNVIIGTIVGTAFAITTGVKPDVAVGVAVPFAVAVQMGITFLFSVMSGVMSRCDRMAENADTRGIERVNYLALLALGTFYFLCAFLPIYFGAEHAKTIIDVLPHGRHRRRGRHHASNRFCRAAENHDEKRLHPLLHPGLCCRSLAQVTGAGYCCRCAGDGADRPAA